MIFNFVSSTPFQTFAASNQFDGGQVLFNSNVSYTIGDVVTQTIGTLTFADTIGVTSINGEQFFVSSGGIAITSAMDAGTGTVFLVGNGDITQTAGSSITAAALGVRQESLVAGENVILTGLNNVSIFAAFNASEDGQIAFNNTSNLTIDNVASVTFCGLTFSQTTGVASEGDILIQTDGSLLILQSVNADDKANDLRLIANGDIRQSSTGTLIADELGVRQQQAVFDGANDENTDSEHGIQLNEANDVNALAMLNVEANGDLSFNDINDLRVDEVITQTIGNVTFATSNGVVSTGSGTINLVAAGAINDGSGIAISTGGNASFTAGLDIELVNEVSDSLATGGNASFNSSDIEVGQDGAAAGANTNVQLGNLTVVGPTTGTADITEDDSTFFFNATATGQLVITSGNNISNLANTSILADQIQFNAVNQVQIGNQTGDTFAANTATQIAVGVNAANATLVTGTNGAFVGNSTNIRINGDVPLDPSINQSHATFVGDPFQLGTSVSDTLFVRSDGFIDQVTGNLDALNLGLIAANHIHLASVSNTNAAFAAVAGEATAVNQAAVDTRLTALAAIQGSEVRQLVQSVSIDHQGNLVLAQVTDQGTVETGSPASISGVTTSAINSGSIFLEASTSIAVNADASATSFNALPQITTYVASPLGGANDPNAITFNGGQFSVTGTEGAATNQGVVNNSEVRAFFGFDSNGDGVIDAFLDGTTNVVQLGATGATEADQFVRAQYGNPGEAGYRLAFVWDSQRRFDAGFGAGQENPNLYTFNDTTNNERYDVIVFNQDAFNLAGPTFLIDAADFGDFNAFLTTIEGNGVDPQDPETFGFNTLFAKVDPWSAQALVERIGDPRIFTTVEVRNDQDINLFVGDLDSVDNSLNSLTETLESTLETRGVAVPSIPFEIERNSFAVVDVVTPPPQQVNFIQNFEPPEPPRPDSPGRISYIAVRIGDPDNPEDIPEDYVIEVDGELILKNPQADYAPLDPKDSPIVLEDVEKNEIEQIIERIERDENAEAGLWYKIFIDYEDGSGKKDELLFYYFKTGQQQESEIGPESDFESNVPMTDGDSSEGDPDQERDSDRQSRVLIKDGNLRFAGRVSELDRIASNDPISDLKGSEKLGLSAGTLMLATLAARNNEALAKQNELKEENFSRFERFKRSVGRLIGIGKRA